MALETGTTLTAHCHLPSPPLPPTFTTASACHHYHLPPPLPSSTAATPLPPPPPRHLCWCTKQPKVGQIFLITASFPVICGLLVGHQFAEIFSTTACNELFCLWLMKDFMTESVALCGVLLNTPSKPAPNVYFFLKGEPLLRNLTVYICGKCNGCKQV